MNPSTIPTVSIDDLPSTARIVDVRELDEWAAGHVEGARHIPMSRIPATLADDPGTLTPDERIYVICAVGGRSANVTAWLVQQGWDAVNVAGGMHAWDDAGRPMTSDTGRPPIVM